MNDFFNNPLIIGAIISIFSSTIILLVQTFITWLLSNRGKVNIYIKSVYNKTSGKGWGFDSTKDGIIYFHIPLWIEFHNTKSVNQIIRNVNISLYRKGVFISKMVQVSHHYADKEAVSLGNNGSYSFLLGPNEISRYDLEFLLKKEDVQSQNFDEAKISYYDTEDKYREYIIYQINDAWELKEHKIDKDWRRIN